MRPIPGQYLHPGYKRLPACCVDGNRQCRCPMAPTTLMAWPPPPPCSAAKPRLRVSASVMAADGRNHAVAVVARPDNNTHAVRISEYPARVPTELAFTITGVAVRQQSRQTGYALAHRWSRGRRPWPQGGKDRSYRKDLFHAGEVGSSCPLRVRPWTRVSRPRPRPVDQADRRHGQAGNSARGPQIQTHMGKGPLVTVIRVSERTPTANI